MLAAVALLISAFSSGVAVSTANNPDDETQRIIFHDGKVTAIEVTTR